jgi:ligand-binding sensor domain-containing protein
MKKQCIQAGLCLFLAFGQQACTSQQPTKVAEKKPEKQDFDPYFIETTAINSPYGPKSITRNTVMDQQGNMWLASWEGIIRYDGHQFTNFTNQNGLRRFHVFSASKDSKGHLWFGTIRGGVYQYDGKTFRLFTTADGLACDWVESITEAANGDIWLGSNEGISCYDGQKFRTLTTDEDGVPIHEIHCVFRDKSGKMWIGSHEGVTVYNPLNAPQASVVKRPDGEFFNNVRCITEGSDGAIWIAGQDGLFRYDGQKTTLIMKGFAGFVYTDKRGNIWVSASEEGSHKMALYFIQQPVPPSETFDAPKKVYDECTQIFSINEDANGYLWLGTEGGAVRYDGKIFRRFLPDEPAYFKSIGDAEFDPKLDDISFQLCYEPHVFQYFNDSNALEYAGEKAAIRTAFQQQYHPPANAPESGLVRIRFVVNCQGKTDRFRVLGADEQYREKTFSTDITDQLLAITRSLTGWKPKQYRGANVDYYQYLTFILKNGLLTEILP